MRTLRFGQGLWLRAGALGTAMLLGACGIDLNPAEKTRLFHLEPDMALSREAPASPAQLVIEVPETARALDTDRIAVRKGAFELSYYAGVRWTDKAPRLIQTYLLESFENSGKIVAVGRKAVGLGGNYALKGELWDFQVEMKDGAPDVVVTYNAKLIEQPAARIISSRTFRGRVHLSSQKLSAVIAGFNRALGEILPDLAVWTLTDMEMHRIKKEQEMRDMMDNIDEDAEEEAAPMSERQDKAAPGEAKTAGQAGEGQEDASEPGAGQQ